MIWLTWRQHRRQALFTGIGLAVLAALMIPTGLVMRHTFAKFGLPDCVRKLGHAELAPHIGETCNTAFNQFNSQYRTLGTAGVLFLVLPLLVGLFWGAPLVAREIEHGTHRLVWTQGVSRQHWALVKFGLVGTATLSAAVVYGLGMSWWLTPLSQAGQARLGVFFFDMQGLVPIFLALPVFYGVTSTGLYQLRSVARRVGGR